MNQEAISNNEDVLTPLKKVGKTLINNVIVNLLIP